MDTWLKRTELLIGKDNLDILKKSTIAIFGIGGVGSFATEALARAGIGNLILIDNDVVDITNINRQLIADTTVIGKPKVEVTKKRLLQINPNINIKTFQTFYEEKNCNDLITSNYNYIVDCIDSISSKISLIQNAKNKNIPIISSMGTGNKLNPTLLEVSDIYKTSTCPLAKVLRKELKARNIKKLKVVYSKEEPIKKINRNEPIPSISFVPSVCGLILASEVIKDLIK